MVAVLFQYGDIVKGEVLLPAHLVQQQQLILQLVQHDYLQNWRKLPASNEQRIISMSQRRYDIENLPSAPVSLGRVKDSMML